MVQILLIGIGAGAAAALLFASLVSGSLLSIFLFYLSPLPILIAAIGWSHWAALVAALFAAAGLAMFFGTFFFLAFMIGVGLPAWWLGYLALLARPSATGDGLDWYPPGHLVVWAALLGALVVVAALPSFGTDEASLRATIKSGVERIMRLQTRTPANTPLELPGRADINRVIDVLIMVIPPAAAVFTTMINVLILWLAAQIVKVSGRLKRPWPDLSAIAFPFYAPLLIAAATLGSFLPGFIGIVSSVLAASLLMAYALLGFAVLHSVTRGMKSRGFVLAGIYASVAVFYWPILAMTLLGLADTALDIRSRMARRRPPASPPPI